MPSKTVFAATLIGAGLVAACAGGPRAAAIPAGLAYECEPGGLATIAFNGGGYLPESRVWGTNDKGERVQIFRSGAELTYDGRTHLMVAEVAPTGLRYRSAAAQDDGHYLVWSMGADEPAGAENAALSLRSDPRAGQSIEREIARCARSGRAHSAAGPNHAREPGHGTGDTHRP